MSMDVVDLAGNLLLMILGGFAVAIGFRYWMNVGSRKRVVDRTLSEFDRSEAPQLYPLQAMGHLVLIAAGLGMCIIGLVRFFGRW
jgi:hypothetical protein